MSKENIEKQLELKKAEFESLKWIVSQNTPNYAHNESIKVHEEHLNQAMNLKKEINKLEKLLNTYG